MEVRFRNQAGGFWKYFRDQSRETVAGTTFHGPSQFVTRIHIDKRMSVYQYAFDTPVDLFTTRSFLVSARNFFTLPRLRFRLGAAEPGHRRGGPAGDRAPGAARALRECGGRFLGEGRRHPALLPAQAEGMGSPGLAHRHGPAGRRATRNGPPCDPEPRPAGVPRVAVSHGAARAAGRPHGSQPGCTRLATPLATTRRSDHDDDHTGQLLPPTRFSAPSTGRRSSVSWRSPPR